MVQIFITLEKIHDKSHELLVQKRPSIIVISEELKSWYEKNLHGISVLVELEYLKVLQEKIILASFSPLSLFHKSIILSLNNHR